MQQTRLAAIMFTDIVGYSRLMEEDEQRTIQVLQQHNQLVLPLIAEGRGEVVDAIGDGLLVIYHSAFDAVQSALEIHAAVRDYNETAAPRMRFALRIGIHIGDIWQQNDRVYGNGVNVAARVQPHAPAGGIALTEDVYTQIVNKLSAPIEVIGRPELKNISRSIMLYRVTTGCEHNAARYDASSVGPENQRSEDEPTLDAIKERLLAEKQKISQQRERANENRGHPEQRLESVIENGVYSLVEGIMDRAVEKWEQMPAERRAETVRAMRSGAGAGVDADDLTINLAGSGAHYAEESKDEHHGGSGTSDLSLGLVMTAGFTLGTVYFGIGWMVWPLVLLGVFPTGSGLYKLVRKRVRRRREARNRPRRLEQEILHIAQEYGGHVTVVQIATKLDASLDEVQQVLDNMTVKGYVSQNVLESGVIQYEFPAIT